MVLDDQNRSMVIAGDDLTFDQFVGNGPILVCLHSHSSQLFLVPSLF